MYKMPFKSYRKESKDNYGVNVSEAQGLSLEQLNTGALLRMADATEAMATNHVRMQNERDQYKRWYENEQKENATLVKRVAALKGVINKMKNAK